MNDPLANLLAYSFGDGLAEAVQPRLPARFEPVVLPGGERESFAQVSGETGEIPVSEQVVFPEIPSSLPPTVSPQSVIAPPFDDMTSHRQADTQPVQRLTPTVDGIPSAWGQPPTAYPLHPDATTSAGLTTSAREVASDKPETAGIPTGVVPEERQPVFVRRHTDRVGQISEEVVPDKLKSRSGSPDIQREAASIPELTDPPVAARVRSSPTVQEQGVPNHVHHAPRITIRIGRVEVRAIPVTSPPPATRSRLPTPALSLDEYLRRRDGGTS
jgi:hypothetical protein